MESFLQSCLDHMELSYLMQHMQTARNSCMRRRRMTARTTTSIRWS